MCKDRTSTMKEIYQHFEQHFVEPFSFPNPAGAGSLGKSGPRLDSSTTGTFVMKRSYTETCAAYEAYAVAKPQCKMAKSTCLGLFTAGGLLQHYSYDERSSCMCDTCHRAEHISLVEQLQGTHGVKGLDGLRSMGHMAPSLFTVDTNLFVKQIGSVAHWPTRRRDNVRQMASAWLIIILITHYSLLFSLLITHYSLLFSLLFFTHYSLLIILMTH